MPEKRAAERRRVERRRQRRRQIELPVPEDRRLLKDRRVRFRRAGLRRATDHFTAKKRLFAKSRPKRSR
jgi:hypothetical protein